MSVLGLGTGLIYRNVFGKIPYANEKSVLFDGTDDYGEVTNYSAIATPQGSSGMTWSMWVYSTRSTSTDMRTDRVLSKSSLTNKEWVITVGGGQRFRFFIYFGNSTSSGDRYRFVPQLVLAKDTWYHAVFTWDSTKATNDMTAINGYINGTKYNSTIGNISLQESESTGSATVTPSSQPIEVGKSSLGGHLWQGYIDEVSIFNTVLSDAAVTEMYNSGTPIDLTEDTGNYTNSSDLVGYWRMGEQDTGTTITNLSSAAGAEDMTLENGAAISANGVATSLP